MSFSIIKKIPLLLILLVSACATTNDQTMYEIIRLNKAMMSVRNDVNDIQKRLSITKGSVPGQDGADMLNTIKGSQTDLNKKIEDLGNGVQALTGRFEERSFNSDKFFEESKTDRDVMRAEIATIENKLVLIEDALKRGGVDLSKQTHPPATPPQPSGTPAVPPPTTPSDNTSAKAQKPSTPAMSPPAATTATGVTDTEIKTLYDEAVNDMNSGDYSVARKKFTRITKELPANKYTDSSHYWLAESYYKDGRYEDAIVGYQAFVKLYPKNQQVPGAKLKQALSFLEIKDKDTAVAIFRQLVNEYPNSKEAEIAGIKLKGLNEGTKPKPKPTDEPDE